MGASDILEEKIAKHMAGAATWTPGTYYLALFTSSTGLETGSATSEVQSSATLGYNRQAVTLSWGGVGFENEVQVTSTHAFTASGGAWNNVSHVALCFGSTPGVDDIETDLALDEVISGISDGSTVNFASGDLVFEVD